MYNHQWMNIFAQTEQFLSVCHSSHCKRILKPNRYYTADSLL